MELQHLIKNFHGFFFGGGLGTIANYTPGKLGTIGSYPGKPYRNGCQNQAFWDVHKNAAFWQ